MKISVIIPDLSCVEGNCMSRGYLFAKILQRRYDVEIVGPMLGEEIWQAVAQDENMTFKPVDFKGIKKREYGKLSHKIQEVQEQIDGDVIYASKPLLTSFGIGLLTKIAEKKPVLVDMDDWQMGFRKQSHQGKPWSKIWDDLVKSAQTPHTTPSYWNNWIGEKLTGLADELTVSNRFLQQKFGGHLVRHAEDTDVFSPDCVDKQAARERLGIPEGQKIIMFCGSPRKHKGVEDLVAAIALMDQPEIRLAVVGNDQGYYSTNFVKKAQETLGDRFIAYGLQPLETVPQFLAAADIAVIPQQKNYATLGQIPIKVFDAMAMAKPIIATEVSDLPEILDGCGWIVPPENPEAIAQAIAYVCDHPDEAESAGQKARIKCVENYSWDAIEEILGTIFKSYE